MMSVGGWLMGMGYPTGKITLTGAGVGKISYSRAGVGFLSGKILFRGCGYGVALPGGYVPVAISTNAPSNLNYHGC